ncbi:TPA: UDP-N-acetylmuramate--L-alanine ligase [Candidatus Dependentiae bacterium]|nr:MAG: UDP-N-acetylmuramate-L-alanine ligase [candidate division TM6 bacterium GW2011_GWE2_31_21]KKP54150.1 MAG: UDP-N-acetylmuramate-L-alanine ligase [candidate division TM6 bacterium GW2011_GWF2_33_332]HBS47871.1 UDP-N-acetylmuramate--L-alanine ligase [Candidatus Dependentiae bacterium]HBZ73056.1 UDP-N-acetylmuramate--L-alanine ligase [Candidatus Dependentiae bacterium]
MFKQKHVHFIGIGGIGMSGIAEILNLQGYKVSGCDLSSKDSKVLDHLKYLGCEVFDQHSADHLQDVDVVVYSSAVRKDNPEIVGAIEQGIPVIPRALMLAELMRAKNGITISGAHGKTTTTSLISHILIEVGQSPTVVVGGILKNISNNALIGKSNLLIAEADESDRSFLYLNPTYAIVTNIDAEHLDTYKDLDDIKNTFKSFLSKLPFYGRAIVCIDDASVRSILPLNHVPTIKYGLSTDADVMGEILEIAPNYSRFNVYLQNPSKLRHHSFNVEGNQSIKLGEVLLNIPGKYNVLNALAAISLCLEFKIPFEQIEKSIESFKGVERRFEFKGTFNGAELYDDYGHHPTEIKNALTVARLKKKNKLVAIFQPHRFSRTFKLWDDFVETFSGSGIDVLYITDIYPASEDPIDGVTSERLAKAIAQKDPLIKIIYFPTYDEIEADVRNVLQPDDLLLTIGAGKVNKIAEHLAKS